MKSQAPSAHAVVNALDPATGAALWSTPLAGNVVGGPIVRSDGTIVALIDTGSGHSLVILDRHSGAPTQNPMLADASQLIAVTTDGVLIGGNTTGKVVAFTADGTVLWTHSGGGNATIASDGTVVSFGPADGISAIDGATGATRWQLQLPVDTCITDAALTSAGGIVALQCDGTLFGASD